LRFANLNGANLTNANLDLTGVNSDIDLTGANLDGAKIKRSV